MKLSIPFEASVIQPYIDNIECFEQVQEDAARRGQCEGERDVGRNDERTGDVGTAEFHQGDGLLVRRSTELDRLGDEEEENSNAHTKRQRDDKSKFYWNQDQNLYAATLSLAHELLHQQISVHSNNIKGALRDLDVALNKPSLLKVQWTNILLNNYIDFDKFASHSFTTEAEDQGLFLVSNTTLEFKKSKVVLKINSHGQWISAFRTYEQAVPFAFKG
ncbi:hypothetical protein GYMLUDRAFT_985797 [Collybiopsis luxurians FD-317 M1]|uniref:Uncharacterized protein n=1 Tax=Collybiopsis luxurians FD-317 M1 TaxID=944289 RepID=A0A0D0B8T0_9AGAR|nr:hypothetical protein GYMLUDRAFT_985797 [Collybiopsis luxurians FD-317 M1]